jgi:hypothetical protein
MVPAKLTELQKEWLLEMDWAQRAFLSSYMISVINNLITFSTIHTLNISRISDRYVPMLNRMDFWDTLPSLNNLVLRVIPSWHSVHRHNAGAETPEVDPAGAIDPFHALLQKDVSQLKNVTHLTIGWATGGEHAEGIFARNRNILPSPLLSADAAICIDHQTLRVLLLQFPFVEHLILENCWLTPSALSEFLNLHDALRLKDVVFESVSLTALLFKFSNSNDTNNMLRTRLQALQSNKPGLAAIAVQAQIDVIQMRLLENQDQRETQ